MPRTYLYHHHTSSSLVTILRLLVVVLLHADPTSDHNRSNMKSSLIVALVAAILSSAVVAQKDCYFINNYGWVGNSCEQCRGGFSFREYPGEAQCEQEYNCCSGLCCNY